MEEARVRAYELSSHGSCDSAHPMSRTAAGVCGDGRPVVDLFRAVERSVEEGQPRADLGGADKVVEDLAEEELSFTRLDQKDNLPLRQ